MEILHATCVCLGGRGILIRGPSGSGKSDLGLRLIDRGGMLVADDLVAIVVENARAIGCLPDEREAFRGALEIRGIGILSVPHAIRTTIDLAIELGETPERLPGPEAVRLAGVEVRSIKLAGFEASAVAKVSAALQYGYADVAA